MTHEEAIAELVRIWHSPHLDLSLKTGLAEVIETLKEKNQSDSLVRDDAENCKESESKLDLISRQDAIKNAHFPMIDDAGYEVVRVDDILALPSAEPKTGEWIPVSDIRKLEDVVYMHIDSLEGTRNIVEAGMLSAWKEVAEYVDGMLGEDGEA